MGTPTVIIKSYRVNNKKEQAEIMPKVLEYFRKTFYRFGEKNPWKPRLNDSSAFRYHGKEYSAKFEEDSKKVQVARGLEIIVGEVKITIGFPNNYGKFNARLMRRIARDLKLPSKPIDDF